MRSLRIKVDTKGSLTPLEVTAFTITTDQTTSPGDIDSVEIFYTGGSDMFSAKQQFASPRGPASTMTFKGRQVLTEGSNIFWVSYKLKDSADLLHKVDAGCLNVKIKTPKGAETITPDIISPPVIKRIGYNIRTSGDDGVSGYRIPGLAATNKGTLIAVYDIRRHGMSDLPGDIDVGMSRSTDGGQSWQPMKVIMDMGTPHKTA